LRTSKALAANARLRNAVGDEQARDVVHHLESSAHVGIERRERAHRLEQLCLNSAAAAEPRFISSAERGNEVKARMPRGELHEVIRKEHIFWFAMTREQ